ncbi:hypothetical protein DL240_08450 [Lujinxingia litoralis]|uniref:Phospholipid/glycerol acyltransferase domain-containing protein n=1 Tax=Lujinxingia litoralis TaxID=2211119 RepID=A0A328C778_9DELT|nr:lysophospholipid acyltransferase family protein [Lujinxingia litoralis]RAL22912.1 hypothetical protein DL240_08450 [Lujinxingia litoralis]
MKPSIPIDSWSVKAVRRALSPLHRYFDVQLEGVEHVPRQGPAFLVGNHALLGIDSFVLFPALMREFERVPRGLALRSLFDNPVMGRLLHDVGIVPGSRTSGVALLGNGQLVVTYPGGMSDSVKGRHQRYTLQWRNRSGFAHVALRSGVPVTPVAAVGPDEIFPILSRRGIFPVSFLGDHRERAPAFLPVARPVRCVFRFGEPVPLPEIAAEFDAARELPTDLEPACQAYARQVEGALDRLIRETLDDHPQRRRFRLPGS